MKRFTLLELLITVAIIAILAAVLMPGLNKARHRALPAQCTGILSKAYADDQEDRLPVYNDGISSDVRIFLNANDDGIGPA